MFTNVTLLFFVLLFPLAGFIAWAGDRIGHRTGKRRHSFLGLRPRHTATVFTIGSGIAIAMVSFGLFWLSSETFRVVVRDGAKLYRHNLHLKAENHRQDRELRLARIRVDETKRMAAQFEEERKRAEQASIAATRELRRAEALQAETERKAKAAQSNYTRASQQLIAARAELVSAREKLQQVQGQLRRKAGQIAMAEQRIRIAESQARSAETLAARALTEQKNAQIEAKQARESAVRVSRNAVQQKQILENTLKKTEALRVQLDEQKRQYEQLMAQTREQQETLTRLVAELQTKRAEYDQVAASTNALRRLQITYNVGEEVDRIPIRAGHNVWRIQTILYSLLTTSAKKAEKRGAARSNAERAVVVLPRQVVASTQPGASESSVRTLTEDDAVTAAAAAIRRANEDVVVVTVARANAVVGEPVVVDFQIYRNPVVLRANTRIAGITLNGRDSRQEVADLLYTFLTREVHEKLIEAGMIPIARSGDPEAGSAQRSDEFSLSGEEWLDLMDRVRRAGPRAEVTVYAARDLRAGDPVALRFDVKGRPQDGPGF